VKSVVILDANVFEIECMADGDCRPDIANLVVDKGWGLLELNISCVSLEDIFLELTAEQGIKV
jgi:hypothetical protein